MFLFRKRQKGKNNILSIEENQELSTIEKEIDVYIESENEDINKKIYQKLMEATNK
jgi:low affinity Fe/Cu permease